MRFIYLIAVVALSSCASYKYARTVKLISFEDDVKRGKSVGPIRGEDCQFKVLGVQIGSPPSLDKAFANTRTQSGSLKRTFSSNSGAFSDNSIRYLNNVSTEVDGFDAGFFAKQCLVVKGVGYR